MLQCRKVRFCKKNPQSYQFPDGEKTANSDRNSDHPDDILTGGIKINFNVKDPVLVANEVRVGERTEFFITKFKFSNKSIVVLNATNKASGRLENRAGPGFAI